MHRRAVLTGAFAGAGALAGCATVPATTPVRPAETCLPPVRVAAERVIRTVVGLRPYRPGGFVVRADKLGDKRLVHNYGHGGSGVTLSWGTARLALELGAPGHAGPVAVLGCGVVGLATARLAQEAGFDVTIYAADLPPQTTSNIAGGQWYPSLLYNRRAPVDPAFQAQLEKAAAYAYRRLQIMVGADYGVRWMRNYELYGSPAPAGPASDAWLHRMMPQLDELRPGQHPFGDHYVRQWDGLLVEPPAFLRRMLEDFRIAGGRVVVRRFASLAEVAALPETLVFNCTGLGARELFGDADLHPLRGQLVILLPQPEVTYAVTGEDGLYMFSRADGVLLGGTADLDNWNLEPDPATTERLLSGHRALFAHRLCMAAAA